MSTDKTTIIDTACSYAWNYPIIDMGRGELRNCCRTPFNSIKQSDWELGPDLFNKLTPIIELKRDLLSGIKNSKCNTCWSTENQGVRSARTGFDEFAKFINAVKWTTLSLEETQARLKNLTDADIGELADLEYPEKIELSLSTTCDLKCVYCSHVFSTQWASERLKYGEISIDQVPKNSSDEYEKIWWDWFEKKASKTVKSIVFVGGEPLINDKFYQYVEKLVDFYLREGTQGRYIHIYVATNLNTPKKYMEKLLSLLRLIKSTRFITMGIGLSVESTGKKNEFIRSNSDWDTFDSNVNDLIAEIKLVDPGKFRKFNVTMMPAINSLSVSDMPNFIRYILGIRAKFDRCIRISTTHVTHPMRYSPFILSSDYSKYIDESIALLKSDIHYNEINPEEGGSWVSFTQYIESLKKAINNNDSFIRERTEFLQDLEKLSVRRKLNYKDTFPEMTEFFELCKNEKK